MAKKILQIVVVALLALAMGALVGHMAATNVLTDSGAQRISPPEEATPDAVELPHARPLPPMAPTYPHSTPAPATAPR